jgi:hypothetical protein
MTMVVKERIENLLHASLAALRTANPSFEAMEAKLLAQFRSSQESLMKAAAE